MGLSLARGDLFHIAPGGMEFARLLAECQGAVLGPSVSYPDRGLTAWVVKVIEAAVFFTILRN